MRTLVSRVPMSSENLAGRTVGGYRLLERVGEGGTAEVYRAEHPERGPCAFKVLRQRLRGDPTAVKRFLREAGYGSRVRHPGVVRTYDYGEAAGLYYLAPEWAGGDSLADYVHHAGPPEALWGGLVDGRADISSLATTTYWLPPGTPPFPGRPPGEFFQHLLPGTRVPLTGAAPRLAFPPALETAILKGLARDPANRQPTVTEFAVELEAALAARPATKGGGLLGAIKRIVGGSNDPTQ